MQAKILLDETRNCFFAAAILVLLAACNMTGPQQYFDVAVLNANSIGRFGGKEIYDMLQEPPQTYDQASKKMAPSSYVDYVKFKTSYVAKAYKDIQALSPTDDAKPFVEASKDVFGYVVDKEQTGYLAIAALKDAHVADDSIKQAAIDLDRHYGAVFGQKYDKLIDLGKAYAEKHRIKAEFKKY